MQGHYLRVLSKADATLEEQAILVQRAFAELQTHYETKVHPKGGLRVFFVSDLNADIVIGALDKFGLMIAL